MAEQFSGDSSTNFLHEEPDNLKEDQPMAQRIAEMESLVGGEVQTSHPCTQQTRIEAVDLIQRIPAVTPPKTKIDKFKCV